MTSDTEEPDSDHTGLLFCLLPVDPDGEAGEDGDDGSGADHDVTPDVRL